MDIWMEVEVKVEMEVEVEVVVVVEMEIVDKWLGGIGWGSGIIARNVAI